MQHLGGRSEQANTVTLSGADQCAHDICPGEANMDETFSPTEVKPLKIEDLAQLHHNDLRFHEWKTIGDRLLDSKFTCRAVAQSQLATEAPLHKDWIRERWNELRTPGQSRMGSRPSSPSVVEPVRSLTELVSKDAFHQQLSALHGEPQTLPKLRLLQQDSFIHGLPPAPNFDPPVYTG